MLDKFVAWPLAAHMRPARGGSVVTNTDAGVRSRNKGLLQAGSGLGPAYGFVSGQAREPPEGGRRGEEQRRGGRRGEEQREGGKEGGEARNRGRQGFT